jgi:hypothetical protein
MFCLMYGLIIIHLCKQEERALPGNLYRKFVFPVKCSASLPTPPLHILFVSFLRLQRDDLFSVRFQHYHLLIGHCLYISHHKVYSCSQFILYKLMHLSDQLQSDKPLLRMEVRSWKKVYHCYVTWPYPVTFLSTRMRLHTTVFQERQGDVVFPIWKLYLKFIPIQLLQ